MRNRKRHTAQPMLEPMEPRVAPSVTAIHVHHERAIAAHVGHVSPVKDVKVSPHDNNKAWRNLQQQLAVVHAHALERTPSAIPTAAEQQATQVSNVFKSLESAL
jgi:hypothetical protein